MRRSRDHGPEPAGARLAAAAILLAALLLPAAARAEIRITLDDAFIEKYKDRATIDAAFTVDKAHPRPNPPASDGDLHAAGRAPEIGLAAVAEVMNAALEPEAVGLIHQAERSGEPLQVRGVWRLWCEHGGDVEHVQGQPLQPFQTTNPPHVFEIHPLLQVGTQDLAASFQPIAGFTYKDADQAFRTYEQLSSHISTSDGTATVATRMAGYNYVEFVIRLGEEPTHLLTDGLTVRAAILDTGGELLVHERRIVAVAGTAPYNRVKAMHKGEALHVVGIPRLDLSLLSWRIANAARVPGVLDWSLPYEMVLVAVFPDSPTGPDVPPPPPAPGLASPPVEPVAPALPAAPESPADGDVVAVLLKLLGQASAPGTPRGACTFSTGQRAYCAALSGAQCDQLGGAWSAGEGCPPPEPAMPPMPPMPPMAPTPPEPAPAASSPAPASAAAPQAPQASPPAPQAPPPAAQAPPPPPAAP
jgi:hypothetical protein